MLTGNSYVCNQCHGAGVVDCSEGSQRHGQGGSIVETHFGMTSRDVTSDEVTEQVRSVLNDLQLQHFQTDAGKREEFTQDFLALLGNLNINFYQREK